MVDEHHIRVDRADGDAKFDPKRSVFVGNVPFGLYFTFFVSVPQILLVCGLNSTFLCLTFYLSVLIILSACASHSFFQCFTFFLSVLIV